MGESVELELIAVAVDDEPMILTLIEEIAREASIRVISFSDPEDAISFISVNEVDMVFTDYRMTKIDGISFVREIRKTSPDIPILMVTVFDDYNIMIEAIKAGATEFVPKPINAVEFLARIRNLAQLRIAQLLLKDKAKQLETEIRREMNQIETREREAILLLGHLLEKDDPEDTMHGERVASYSKIIAKAAGYDEEMQYRISYASLFHDIGKGLIHHEILVKQGELSSEERETLKEHAMTGSRILDIARSEYLKEGGLVALTHHEHYDGSGYPRGLKAEEIPFSGRVVAIADVFDSLTSRRKYRDAWDFDEAIDYIRGKSGLYFDPWLVESFLRSLDDIRNVYHHHDSRSI
jgi:response regulator RpfG family c-di-GMP phosphodiesterase